MESAEASALTSLQPVARPRSRGRLAGAVLGLAVSVAAGYLTVRGADWTTVGATIATVKLWPLALTVVIGGGSLGLLAWRSQIVFQASHSFSIKALAFSHLVALVGNTLMPFRAGELLRIDYLARESKLRHTTCIATLALERLLDLAFMLGLFFASFALTTGEMDMRVALLGATAGVAAAFIGLTLAVRHPHKSERLAERLLRLFGKKLSALVMPRVAAFIDGLAALGSLRSALAVTTLTILRWSLAVLNIRLWLLAFDAQTPWYAPIVVQAFLAFGTAIPSSVAFTGTYHYAVVASLAMFGIAQAQSVSIAVVAHGLTFAPYTLIGAAWIAVALSQGRYQLPLLQRSKASAATGKP